ncbi:MAG TPA: 2-phosphosulfolactate phosphatase [Pelobium sp.]|nr:2-phosphosulfolactate phosphatase [Pelobium sp.]
MQKNIQVCLTPALLPLYDLTNSIVVVIDIFRATSSICYGIENGAEAIIPVATVEECRSHGDSCLLAAERDGRVVDGFDFGNSPFSYTAEKVNGKTVVLTTTNGTHAINESKKTAYQVIIGSFLNLNAVCDYLKSQTQDVLLLCAGWKNKFNLEDTLFAGAVVHQLKFDDYFLDDSSTAAEDLYLLAKDNLQAYTAKTSHSERLKKLGIEEDIKFCLNVNIVKSIPVLVGDRLVKL